MKDFFHFFNLYQNTIKYLSSCYYYFFPHYDLRMLGRKESWVKIGLVAKSIWAQWTKSSDFACLN